MRALRVRINYYKHALGIYKISASYRYHLMKISQFVLRYSNFK